MKMEITIDGKVLVIECEGTFTVKFLEDKKTVAFARKEEAVQGEVPQIIIAESSPVPPSELFERLVELRRELAVAANVPPYVVFKDNALREMVEKLPQDLAEFGNIGGVGKAKLEKYGDMFLSVIKGAAA